MKVIRLEMGTENRIRAVVLKGEVKEKFQGYVWTIIEDTDPRQAIEYALICANGSGFEEVSAILLPNSTIIVPEFVSLSECLEVVYADLIFQQTHGHPVNDDNTVYLKRKDGCWVATRRVTFRLRRLRKLKQLGAPRWITKYEQILCIWNRTGIMREDLIQKYVEPYMGIGSITVPDPDAFIRRKLS